MDAHPLTVASPESDCPLLFGRVLDGHGGGRPIDWATAQTWKPAAEDEVLWLHLLRTCPGVEAWLHRELGIPERTAALLVSDQTRPHAFREGDALMTTLRDVNFNPGEAPEDMISMQLWSDGSHVVTLRRDPQQSPNEIRDRVDRGVGPADAGAMVTQIAETMIQHLSGAVIDLNDAIDALEDAAESADTRDADDRARRISAIRRECLALQRHMSPQHEALEQISRDAPDWFEAHDRRAIAESIARLRRHLDDIDISKESAVVLLDELRTRAQATSQEATYKLGVMAGVFLPLTFLTGLLGTNVAGIPYADQPWAFGIVAAICAVLTFAILAVFKVLRWL